MSKFKSSILILGILVMCVAASLITYIVLSLSGAIVTEPVELVFTVKDKEKEYDGTPLTADEYTLTEGELTEGHRAVVEYTGSQTGVGESQSGMTVKIFNENDYDVTRDYAIKVNGGKLTVEKCEVYIRLNDTEVVYNGETVVFDDYTVTTGSLANGHYAGAAKTAGAISVNDILTEKDVAPVIYDENGNAVTENYEFHFRMGYVSVLPRPLKIRPVSAEKVYDGDILACEQYEIAEGSLASGHRAEVTYVNTNPAYTAFLTNAGEIEICASAVIYNEHGEDVTENYALDTNDTATLRVNKRNLKLTALSKSWEYDGTEHSLESETNPYSAEGLLRGETVEVVYGGSITAVGTAESTIEEFEISGGNDNYSVTLVSGTLTVTKGRISVQFTGAMTKEYDGVPLSLDDIGYESDSATLKIVSSNLAGVSEAGSYPFTATFEVLKDGVNDSGNYEISVTAATYVITPLDVSISYTGTTTKVYDGKPFKVDCSKIQLICTNDEDYEVVSVTSNEPYKAGTKPLDMRYPHIRNKSTGALLSLASLNVTAAAQTVTITPKSISLAVINLVVPAGTSNKDIDDMVEACNPVSAATPLCVGDAPNADMFSIFYNYGDGSIDVYANVTNPKAGIINALGENVTDCYVFTDDYMRGQVVIVENNG